MPNYLSELLAPLPNDKARPTDEHIRIIRDIDAKRTAAHHELIDQLQEAQNQAAPKFPEPLQEGWAAYKGTDFAPVPNLDNPKLHLEHARRVQDMSDFTRVVGAGQFEDGKVKSKSRVEEKVASSMARGHTYLHIPDASRGRIVTPDIASMIRAYQLFHAFAVYEVDLWPAGVRNSYTGATHQHAGPLRMLNTYWQLIYPRNNDHDADTLVTELQFVTPRVRAIMALNHPYDVTKTIPYPTPEHESYVHQLLLKASILDLEEFNAR